MRSYLGAMNIGNLTEVNQSCWNGSGQLLNKAGYMSHDIKVLDLWSGWWKIANRCEYIFTAECLGVFAPKGWPENNV